MTREDVIMTLMVNHMLDRSGLEEVPNEVLLDYMKYFHEECDGIEEEFIMIKRPNPPGVQQIVSLSEDGETITMSTQTFCDMQNQQFKNGVNTGKRQLVRETLGREFVKEIDTNAFCDNVNVLTCPHGFEYDCTKCNDYHIDVKTLFEIIDMRINND